MERHKESPAKIKFIIKSIIPATSEIFTNVIKNSNDSSSDNLLEFRSLSTNSFKIDTKSSSEDVNSEKKNKSYSAEVKNFIQKILSRDKMESLSEIKDDSGCKSEENESSESLSDLVITKKQKINDSDGSAIFATMASSTPIKLSERRCVNLDISGVGFLSFQKDDKGNFDDSDFESMDQDQYDESKMQDEDVTLVNSHLVKVSSSEFPALSRTSSLTDFKNGFKMILEETVKRTPMAFRKAFNIDISSNSSAKKPKFLNLFSSTKKARKKQSPGKKNIRRQSSNGKKKYPLTKENLQKYLNVGKEDKRNIEWDENFEYSFTCEPASSLIGENENSPNYISYNTSLDNSIELMKSPLIPTFRVEPPSDVSSRSTSPHGETHPCDYVRHVIKCSYASRLSLSTSLKRSKSEPAIEDEKDLDASLFAFLQSNTTETCEASVRNLTQLSVSKNGSGLG